MPALAAGGAPRYRPRAASNALKDIVEDALEDLLRLWEERFWREHGPLHRRVRDLMDAFVRCGDPHFGFLRLHCVNAECASKTERIVPFSCKARGLCPSCSQKRALLWAERMVSEVLPHVPYVQLVFTIPKMLRKAFLFDRSLYGDLSRAAYASTRELFQEHFPGLQGAVPAMVVSPQSHGSLLNFHPHLHALSSLGVFDSHGRFHPVPEDLDFSPLQELFRQRTLKLMLQREILSEERARMLQGWRHSGFHADASRRLAAEDRSGLEQVLVYMERAPVALERLEYRRDARLVHYRGNWHPSLGRDHQLLPPVDFLALLVPHVLLRFQCVIRTYGALSTTLRRRFGWIKKPAPPPSPDTADSDGEESEFVRARRRNWARLIAKVWLEDPSFCPSCGKEMKVLATVSSPDQDDVIERILRARGQWDPPWLRTHSARGPPAAPTSSPRNPRTSIDPLPPDEVYIVDPDPDDS